jgi:hypothetical protein
VYNFAILKCVKGVIVLSNPFKFAIAASLILTSFYFEQALAKDKETLQISSTSFQANGEIAKKYTADGEDVSPQIIISKLPSGTKSIALSCEDPDAPSGTWFHWLIWNLSPATTELKEGVLTKPELADGSLQGLNDFKKTGYNGPSPPKGPAHHYHFKVFALDQKLDLKANSDKASFYKAVEGHVLGTGEVVGLYGRK